MRARWGGVARDEVWRAGVHEGWILCFLSRWLSFSARREGGAQGEASFLEESRKALTCQVDAILLKEREGYF